MKFRKFGVFYTLMFALIVFALMSGGCGGSSSNSSRSALSNGDYSEVIVLTSKVFTDGETYKFYRGGTLYNGTEAYNNKYYVASINSANTTDVTIKLGLYEELDDDVLTVTDSNNNIVYAYNPAGTTSTTTNYPSSLTLSGSYEQLKYYSLSFGTSIASATLDEEVEENLENLEKQENNGDEDRANNQPEMPVMPTVQSAGTSENSLNTAADTVSITLSGTTASISGTAIKDYDYVWHASPSVSVDYYTNGINGTTMMSESEVLSAIEAANDTVYHNYGVYIAHDIRYMPSGLTFSTQVANDEEKEYACFYDSSVVTEAKAKNSGVNYSNNKIIFATMPTANASSTMTFSASTAYNNPVLHITKAGTYSLSGSWTGQIWIDVGEDAASKVKLILNGVTVTCGVAPALVFHDLYECETGDENSIASGNSFLTLGTSSGTVTSSNAGAVVELASGTTNNFTGANVYRMLKIDPKKDSVTTISGEDVSHQKKLWKMDAAFYSFVSMVIQGSGTLNVTSSTYEGLDTEMHLSVNGGTVNVTAPDDGINTNEDSMSVFTMNGGTLTVSSTGGDGIDSNGYIVINGGTLTAKSGGGADHGLDSDLGVYIATSGATVYADSVENQKTTTGYTGTYSTVSGNGNNNGTPGGETPPDNGSTPPGQNGENGGENQQNNGGTSTTVTIDSSGSTLTTLTTDTDVSTLTSDTNSVSARIAAGVATSGTNFKLSGAVNTFSGITIE